jgi:hypothetical protein
MVFDKKDTLTHFFFSDFFGDKKKVNRERLAHTDHNGNFTTWCSDYLTEQQFRKLKVVINGGVMEQLS